MTLKEARKLILGQMLYHVENRNSDKSPQRWKVNGKIKTWVTAPNKIRIPIKHGLFSPLIT